MFVAINRFSVLSGKEKDFEAVWLGRETHLEQVPGFIAFHLMRGPSIDEGTLYASHTMWRSRADFEAWTRSDAFKAAHKDRVDSAGLYAGRPKLELFESLQEVRSAAHIGA
jgi:heme-degrading monooxygenase HmoA